MGETEKQNYCQHQWELERDWWEDLRPASTNIYQTHRAIIICRKCGEIKEKIIN